MRRVLLAALLTGAVALSATGAARADDAATHEAQARFEEGLRRVRKGDFEAARLSFEQAYVVLHKPDILWNLALAEQKSGHKLEAIGHFRQLERDAEGAADRTRAGKHVKELSAQTAHLEVTAPAGSQVSVDGVALGLAPLTDPVDVQPGSRHVEVRTARGDTRMADAEAAIGKVVHVSFSQTESQPAPVPAAPALAPAPASSPATLPAASEVQPPLPAPQAPVDVAPRSTFWDARGITVVSLGGAAVLAGGLGLAFGVVASSDAGTASSLRAQNPSCAGSTSSGCAQLASTTQSQHSAYVTSEALWFTSGVLALGAVGAYFLWPRSPGGNASVQVLPAVGAGSAGAIAVGSF